MCRDFEDIVTYRTFGAHFMRGAVLLIARASLFPSLESCRFVGPFEDTLKELKVHMDEYGTVPVVEDMCYPTHPRNACGRRGMYHSRADLPKRHIQLTIKS